MVQEIDLTYLDTLLGTSGDDLDAKLLQDLSDENFTVAMYRAGFLTAETDINGDITGWNFEPPQNFDMMITGTSGDDTLSSGNGDDFVYAGEGDDVVDAGDGADFVSGGIGNDTLSGGLGDDMLYGDAGSDDLYGGAGNDTLGGGLGSDDLYGGSGADTFSFEAADLGTGTDIIRDFSIAEGDMLNLADLLTAYDPLTNAIEDFVQITEVNGNSFVSVDVNGGGDSFQTVAVALNTTGITDEQMLVDDGTLVV